MYNNYVLSKKDIDISDLKIVPHLNANVLGRENPLI